MADYNFKYLNENNADLVNEALKSQTEIIKETIKSRALTADFQKLEDYLNNIFYPEDDSENLEYSNLVMNKLREMYESISGKFITSGIGDSSYKAVEKRPTFEKSKEVSRKQVKTLQESYKRVVDALEKLSASGRADQVEELKEKVQEEYGNVFKTVQKVINEYGDENRKNTNFVTAAFANRQGDDGKEVMKAINGLLSLEATLNNAGLIILNTDYGDFFEYALGLLSKDINLTADSTADELVELLKGKIVQGGNRVDRNGGYINMTVAQEIGSKFQQPITRGEKWTYGNISLNYDPSQAGNKNTGAKKQGKVDVIIEIPEVAKGTKFRISAKNWKTIDELRDLGSTTLMDALHRSTDDLTLDEWSFAMQNPEQTYYKVADELARLCVFADIAMGYSQKEGYADTLVINDRSQHHIHVRSISKLICDAIDTNINTLQIKGYDVNDLRLQAIDARELALNMPKGQRSEQYLQVFKNVINGIEVAVQCLGINRN